MSGITLDRALMQSISDEAYEIDDTIISAGSGMITKNRIVKNLVNADTTDLSAIVGYFADLSTTESRIAVFNKLVKTIEDSYKKEFETYFTSIEEATPKTETTEAELDTLRARRKELKAQWDSLVIVWPMVSNTFHEA